MDSTIQIKTITEEDVMRWESKNPQREIINGEWSATLKMAGQKHNLIGVRLLMILVPYAKDNGLGQVYTDGLNYVLEGTRGNIITMYVPDLSFVAQERVRPDEDGFYYFAPDLAIEIMSPTDSHRELNEKIVDYLRLGVQMVWAVYPQTEQIMVHQPQSEAVTYGLEDVLEGGDILPDFKVKVSAIFQG